MKYAIIGGTGVYDLELLQNVRSEFVETPYGEVTLQIGTSQGREVGFMARHGGAHTIPPHRINYRANIFALKKLGAERILATNAVGSVNRLMKPGHFVVVDQFLDFTKTRTHTFFDGEQNPVAHADVTDPYCPELRGILFECGRELGLEIHSRGCYAVFEGPRYETAAEISMSRLLGADVVGMTGVPEANLAREAGICYSAVTVITNMGAGISGEVLNHEDVVQMVKGNNAKLKKLLLGALGQIPVTSGCSCDQGTTPLSGL